MDDAVPGAYVERAQTREIALHAEVVEQPGGIERVLSRRLDTGRDLEPMVPADRVDLASDASRLVGGRDRTLQRQARELPARSQAEAPSRPADERAHGAPAAHECRHSCHSPAETLNERSMAANARGPTLRSMGGS